jgi:predicted transcriptional regulator YdeE
MKPKIIKKDAFLIAGVAGSGDETAKTWEVFAKLDKLNPLKNKAGEESYEIRLSPAEGPGKIHVGMLVKDLQVPAEFKPFFVPAATYAEFEIYPAKGYKSSNAEMSQWLKENAGTYQEALLDGMKYAIEVYDKRYKGEEDPASVVGILVPITPAVPEVNPANMIAGQIREIGRNIKEFAGAEARKKVMAGSEKVIESGDPIKGAMWTKEAMDRLDTLTNKEARAKIMTACGHKCHEMNIKDTTEARDMRNMCTTEEEFLEKFLQPPGNGVRYKRDGNTLIQYYTPQQYFKGLRCYCGLMRGLPEGTNASPTYCQCSRAFTEKHWEGVLGRPVKVELGETALTGAKECKFIIHLKGKKET